jgi:uncharacterized phage-associated protein
MERTGLKRAVVRLERKRFPLHPRFTLRYELTSILNLPMVLRGSTERRCPKETKRRNRVKFLFDIEKSIAAAAYLTKKSGGSITVFKLVKMLYLADRIALLQWHRPITGDSFVSMKSGPVVSHIYDLIKGRILNQELRKWRAVFKKRSGNDVSLQDKAAEVDIDSLSPREVEALDCAFEQIKKLSKGDIASALHQLLPEWRDPKGSSIPIEPQEILKQTESAESIAEIEKELDHVFAVKAALKAAA